LGISPAYAILSETPYTETPFEYHTGFEPEEPDTETDFVVGPLPQNGWEMLNDGSSGITDAAAGVHSGIQGLEISSQDTVDKSLDAEGRRTVWLEGWYKTTPEPEYPELNLLDPGSSLVVFHSVDGIACLDGDGAGGGTWTPTGVQVDPSKWYRVTLKQNYEGQTWACFVNGDLKLSDLGFKDNISHLSGFRVQQGLNNDGYLDDFSAQTSPLIEDFSPPNLFRFSRIWRHHHDETSDENFDEYDKRRDLFLDMSDLYELLKSWQGGE